LITYKVLIEDAEEAEEFLEAEMVDEFLEAIRWMNSLKLKSIHGLNFIFY